MLEYAEILTTTNFSFLQGASHPEEYIQRAKELGYKALAITDHNSLAGVVRAHLAAKTAQLPFIVGSRLTLDYAAHRFEIAAYATNLESYGRLCSLITLAKSSCARGASHLSLLDLISLHRDLALVIVPPQNLGCVPKLYQDLETFCGEVKAALSEPKLLSIALCRSYQNGESENTELLTQLARRGAIPLAAANDVYCHDQIRRPLLDVLTCIKHGCTLDQAGILLFQNSERYLKTPAEMSRLFRHLPEALKRALEIAEMGSTFSLDELRYDYPPEICPPGKTPIEYLSELTLIGMGQRYPEGSTQKVRDLIEKELRLIEELRYEKYFLTCYDIVRFARSRKILCQGRGSAANSAVCYCLGITAVDPNQIDLLFARFISKERSEPPDIDIDFEHERREEVIQYIYQKFGRARAGLVAAVISYRPRSAIREIGKALGCSLDVVGKLAKAAHHWTNYEIPHATLKELGLNPKDPMLTVLFSLVKEIQGFPRHLSQHVGGFIISERPLSQSVPILNAAMPQRTMIEWNKDDIEALGMLKIDVLGLGMLSCIRKALELVNRRRRAEALSELDLHSIPREDSRVYDMICAADTIGVFQIESRAQMSMLPRLKPRCFYDLVIEVAIVRPGPIQGKMVHPYLKRRNGEETVEYPDQRARDILGKTMGIPIFQEQALRLAIVLAGFSPGEAEQLRRALAAWHRNEDLIQKFKDKATAGMIQNGYTAEFASACLRQIQGFSEYGFPESHAASFAQLVYASAWIKRYYPAEFAAALINSQPMGFYAPAQIISDAKKHGVKVLPIDVNFSAWECTLEKTPRRGGHTYALRLGMCLIKGMPHEQAEILSKLTKTFGPFLNIAALWQNFQQTAAGALPSKPALTALYHLAEADAFHSMALSRREAFWHIRALPPQLLPLDRLKTEAAPALPTQDPQQSMFDDYRAFGLSLKAHPLSFLRGHLNTQAVTPIVKLKHRRLPAMHLQAAIAGLVLFRQRPPTSKGVVFITLEDETGSANLIVKPEVFEKYQRLIITARALIARGKVQYIGRSVYIEVRNLQGLELR